MATKQAQIIAATIEQVEAAGLLAEVDKTGDLAVATKSGTFLGAFPITTPARAVIAAAAAYARGLKEGRQAARKSQ